MTIIAKRISIFSDYPYSQRFRLPSQGEPISPPFDPEIDFTVVKQQMEGAPRHKHRIWQRRGIA